MSRARDDDHDEEGERLRVLDSVSPTYSSSRPRPRVAEHVREPTCPLRGDDDDVERELLQLIESVSRPTHTVHLLERPGLPPRVDRSSPFGGGSTTENSYGGGVNRAGVKHLPMDDLSATQWYAEQGKILRHDWRTLRRFCNLLAKMCVMR